MLTLKELFPNLSFATTEIEAKICLWICKDLIKLEKFTGKDFYTSREGNRKSRPFLSIYCKGDTFAALFLTSSSRGYQKKVKLTLCRKDNCSEFPFYEEVYLFRNKNGQYEVVPLNKLQIKEIAKFCGCCENLDYLKKFCHNLEDNK